MRKRALREIPKYQSIECTARLTGCTGDAEVLAHIRRRNVGMGTKPPDTSGCLVCSACHDKIDGRDKPWATDTEILEAVCESQTYFAKELGL